MSYTKFLKNPNNTEFEFFFDGTRYVIPANGVIELPTDIAVHGSRKVADKYFHDILKESEKTDSVKFYLEDDVEKKSVEYVFDTDPTPKKYSASNPKDE